MGKYDYTTPKDVLEEIRKKKREGYFAQKLSDKKNTAQHYEVVLGDKEKADIIYKEIRQDLKNKKLPKKPEGSAKQKVEFMRNIQDKDTGVFTYKKAPFYIQVERAKHILTFLKREGYKPKYPLKFLNKVDTGKKLKEYFKSVLYNFSKNNDTELNLVITGLPSIKKTGFHKFSKDWDDAFYECIEMWQDPKTGYWGPWTKENGKIIKWPQLSITFHMIRIYYDKNTLKLNDPRHDLKHKRKIIQTTWKIKNKYFPYGWLDWGAWSTHHNFDVAEIFLYLFNKMRKEEKEKVRRLFDRFLKWCLKENMKKDGGFVGLKYPKSKEATLYTTQFAILMLRAIGYFSKTYRDRIFKDKKLPINSYRIYKNKIPGNEFDTSNLKAIIQKKKTYYLDPLETRLKIFNFWKNNKGKDLVYTSHMDEVLNFTKFPPKKFNKLRKIPEINKNEILVAVDKYGGVIWHKSN